MFTPVQPEGPFYPTHLLQNDSDLVNKIGAQTRALGEIIDVEGTVTDQNIKVISGVLVEIWQACHSGRYHHPNDSNSAELDPNFQYWGKAITNEKGYYKFRTIIPGVYPADIGWNRPPHIHFKISKNGYVELITQMYFEGHELNEKDQILQRLPRIEQDKLIVRLRPVPNDDNLRKCCFDISITEL